MSETSPGPRRRPLILLEGAGHSNTEGTRAAWHCFVDTGGSIGASVRCSRSPFRPPSPLPGGQVERSWRITCAAI